MEKKRQVIIVGPHRLQNELIRSYLHDEAELPCQVLDSLRQLPPVNKDVRRLVLFDCGGMDKEDLHLALHLELGESEAIDRWALFNLSRNADIEGEALTRRVRGFFYDNDPADLLAKGVNALFNGELWMPRKKMEQCLMASQALAPRFAPQAADLTARENEILALVATGANNEQIGTQLHISPHTVKTHIYNIFKKINVSNRMEAAIWASQQNQLFPGWPGAQNTEGKS